MAGKNYDKAMTEFNTVISELEQAQVITTPAQKEAMQKFMGAMAQDINDFVVETFNENHPGETQPQGTGQKPLTPLEAAEKNRGITTTMVSTTLAEWVRGPNVGIDKEHHKTMDGSMDWVLSNAENKTGQVLYGPLYNDDGTPKLDADGKQISGDIPNNPDINKQWATDVVKLAMQYADAEKEGEAKVNEIKSKADIERQRAKDMSYLYAEAQQRNTGERGTKTTPESLRQEHINMALTYDKQAENAVENNKNYISRMSFTYVHHALHASALDQENANLHHDLVKDLQDAEKRFIQNKDMEFHGSLREGDLTPANMNTVLQHIALRSPDAALAYAKYLNGDERPSQTKAEEVQV